MAEHYGEREYVRAYVRERYRDDIIKFNMRLGQPPLNADMTAPPQRAEGEPFSLQRFADALVLRPDELVLIEAKLTPDAGAVGQLKLYRSLIPISPYLSKWKDLPVRMEIVMPRADANLKRFAEAEGITLIVFQPPAAVGERSFRELLK